MTCIDRMLGNVLIYIPHVFIRSECFIGLSSKNILFYMSWEYLIPSLLAIWIYFRHSAMVILPDYCITGIFLNLPVTIFLPTYSLQTSNHYSLKINFLFTLLKWDYLVFVWNVLQFHVLDCKWQTLTLFRLSITFSLENLSLND